MDPNIRQQTFSESVVSPKTKVKLFLGSGKRALLEVISRRAQGPTRGQILLNGVPMSMRLFQESCGYVTQKSDLLPGLSVRQTLYYAANLTIGSKVRKVLS
jgi:ATP-binding cassette subfamily G (WHITE) protein 5 (sterolin 1)